MKEHHITEVMDSVALASLSQRELDELKAHARDCATCEAAFEAAQLSALVIKQRAQVKIEPSPFFHTRGAGGVAGAPESGKRACVRAVVEVGECAGFLNGTGDGRTRSAEFYVYPDPATAVTEQLASVDAAEAVIFGQEPMNS